MSEPRIRIRLYGVLRERFGKEFCFVGRTPADAIRALCRMKDGFAEFLRGYEPGFHVLAGQEDLGEDDLLNPTPRVVKLVPAVVAASAGSKILAGITLIAVAYFTGGLGTAAAAWWASTAAGLGASLVIGGAAELLANPPKFTPSGLDKGPNDTPTYAFQGPHMTTGQGNCVPLGYGRVRIGGALISLGISPETWTVNGFGGAAPDEAGTMGGDGDTSPWVWAVAPA